MSQLRAFCGSNHQICPTNHIRIWLKWAPFKQKFWLKHAPSNFWDLNQINLIYTLLSRIQRCSDYALFEGHFWPKFGDGTGIGGSHLQIDIWYGWPCPIIPHRLMILDCNSRWPHFEGEEVKVRVSITKVSSGENRLIEGRLFQSVKSKREELFDHKIYI